MNKPRIIYCSKYALNEDQGGPSRQYYFSKHFALKGYETILISSNSSGGKYLSSFGIKNKKKQGNFSHIILKGSEISLGFSYKRIISWIIFEYRLFKELKNLRLTNKDILIVSSLSILTFINGIYFKRKNKVKLVIEVRDIWPLTLIMMSKRKRIIKLVTLPLKLLEKKAYKKADVIIGSMSNLIEHVKNVMPKESNCDDKVVCIPMGMEERIDYEYKLRKSNNKFVVGYAGSIGLVNKIDLIMDTAILLKNNENVEIRILGDGPLKKALVNKAKKEKLDNVIFLDKVKKEKVYEFLINCNILVHTIHDLPIYKYGVSPNKWIDYMYAAKPIIVAYNGYQSIINEAECGEFILTDNPKLLQETIIKYSNMSAEELYEIGKNGREYLMKNLTYNKLSDKYIESIIEKNV